MSAENDYEVVEYEEVTPEEMEQSQLEDANNLTLKIVGNLSNCMEQITAQEHTSETVNSAIDCADAAAKMLAVYHKGREVTHKRNALDG